MSKVAEAYMKGWKYGYHNARLAEQKRIIQLIKANTNEQLSKMLEEIIKKENKNDLRG